MFDLPELSDTNDTWWAGICGHIAALGGDSRPIRSKPADLIEHWLQRDLVLSQTCGWPLITSLRDGVQTLGRFTVRDVSDETGFYESKIVVAPGVALDRPLRVVINNADSLSGRISLGVALSRNGYVAQSIRVSGSHRNSLAMLRKGEADIAAIDGLTWALIGDVAPHERTDLTVVGNGPRIPFLPYITGLQTSASDVSALQAALGAASVDPNLASTRYRLRLGTFIASQVADYESLASLGAIALGCLPDTLFCE